VSFLVDAAVLRVPVVPLLCPVLLDSVVFVVVLAPVLSFLEPSAQVDLPLVAPLLLLADLVNFAPFLVPLFLGMLVLAPLLALRLLDLASVGFVFIWYDFSLGVALLGERFDFLVP